MENPILIILIVVASFAYKIYDNFKKEQEAAKKRLEQLKKQQQMSSYPDAPKPAPVKSKPVNRKINPPLPEIPKKTYEHVQEQRPEVVAEVENFQRMKEEQRRRALLDQQKKEMKPVLEKIEDQFTPQQFDLRKAIIQQAILERPYKD